MNSGSKVILKYGKNIKRRTLEILLPFAIAGFLILVTWNVVNFVVDYGGEDAVILRIQSEVYHFNNWLNENIGKTPDVSPYN
ncbi:MAG: hypothetical protein GY804_07185 [Alphaproteobacteria bacterium]|nr:hypothetical protein [Alphaproteobacteria bacterium]